MKKLFLLMPIFMIFVTACADGEKYVLLDFNPNGTGSSNLTPDTHGRYWNGTAGVDPTATGNICTNARDSVSYATTGINFSLTDGFKGQNTSGPTSSSLVDWDQGVICDNWWISASENDQTAVMLISNLDPTKTYNLKFYGGRNTTGSRPMQVTIDGDSKTYQSASEGMVTFTGLSPNENDQIVVEFYNSEYYGYLSGIELAIVPTAASTNAIMATVVYDTSIEDLDEDSSIAGIASYVLDQKDGTLYYKTKTGDWIVSEPSDNFRIVNSKTNNVLFWLNDKWNIVSSDGQVNVKDFGAMGDYNYTTQEGHDDSDAIQKALNYGKFGSGFREVYIPGGRYLLTKPLNLTTDSQYSHSYTKLSGAGMERTVLYGSTASNGGIVIDCTGSLWMDFQDFSITVAGTANPSTVGFFFSRGEDSEWAIRYYLRHLSIDMKSNLNANNEIGTVAIWNRAGEHHTYVDVFAYANLPLMMSLYKEPLGLPDGVESTYVDVQEDTSCSQGMTTLINCVLKAYDFYRPCLYMDYSGSVSLGCSYLGLLRSSPTSSMGTYIYGVEARGVDGFQHQGIMEGPSKMGYIKCPRGIDNANINVTMKCFATSFTSHESVPAASIDLTPDTGTYYYGTLGLKDSNITLNYLYPYNDEELVVDARQNDNLQYVAIENCILNLMVVPGQSLMPSAFEVHVHNTRIYNLYNRTVLLNQNAVVNFE